ncbi:hypothetical protein VPH35_136540 [Triticum aestivum]
MEGTCITKPRTKKPEDAEDWSWEERLFYGCNIFPGVLDQGTAGLGLCSFTSITSAGQMELNAAVAKKTGQNCMIKLDWESLVTRFLQLNGLKAEDGKLERQKLEEIIFNDEVGYNTPEGAAWCFKHMGIKADIHKDGDNIGTLNVSLHDYRRYEQMDAQEVREHIENGRAIKVRILAGTEFDSLEDDEIYCWLPEIDEDTGKLVEDPDPHAIVLLGNGNAGPSLRNEQYHPFLNSHGKKYAKGGVGCIFFKGLFGPYYLLEMKAEPKLSYGGMSQLPAPPFRTYVPTPPPPGSPASPPCPSAFTTLPAHGRFPAPSRPGAPSTQHTPRYLPPWHPSRSSCLPGPVSGHSLTPPRGRYSMDVPTPPPHDRSASQSHLAAFTPPPPHGRFPAPRRPDAPSTQRATAPHSPPPARGEWPTAPRGRDTIDKKRW